MTTLPGAETALREIALTLLGLVVAVTPLVLWVAWSQTVFVAVLVISAGALILIFALTRRDPQAHAASGSARPVLTGDELASLSNLGPFIYHHRRDGGPHFQRHMRRLKRQLRIR